MFVCLAACRRLLGPTSLMWFVLIELRSVTTLLFSIYTRAMFVFSITTYMHYASEEPRRRASEPLSDSWDLVFVL